MTAHEKVAFFVGSEVRPYTVGTRTSTVTMIGMPGAIRLVRNGYSLLFGPERVSWLCSTPSDQTGKQRKQALPTPKEKRTAKQLKEHAADAFPLIVEHS